MVCAQHLLSSSEAGNLVRASQGVPACLSTESLWPFLGVIFHMCAHSLPRVLCERALEARPGFLRFDPRAFSLWWLRSLYFCCHRSCECDFMLSPVSHLSKSSHLEFVLGPLDTEPHFLLFWPYFCKVLDYFCTSGVFCTCFFFCLNIVFPSCFTTFSDWCPPSECT